MYSAIIIVLLGAAAALATAGVKKRSPALIALGVVLGILTPTVFGLMSFWGEMLWFSELGYGGRFWREVLAKAGATAGASLASWLTVLVLTLPARKHAKAPRYAAQALGVIIGADWGYRNWATILRHFNRFDSGIADPILGMDTSFYMFSLPFYDALFALFVSLAVVSLFGAFASLFLHIGQNKVEFQSPETKKGLGALYASAVLLLLILAAGRYLSRLHLMYSAAGVVTGPGWTDVNVRLPAYTVVIVLTALLALVVAIPPLRQRVQNMAAKRAGIQPRFGPLVLLGAVAVVLIGVWFVALGVIPGLFQWLRVEPNEIDLEKQYITHNIEFTRRGFNIHGVEEREFPARGQFTRQTVEQNKHLFDNIRLWDWRALDAVYKQFQEIRLYFEFTDVDIDRYTIGGRYRQVMVSARELEVGNLPAQSQTFVNRRFKYTHGYGLTLTTVSEFTPQGLPNLLVKDIPPKSEHPELEVTRPEIYYGELTDEHVIANSAEKEFDYPSGDENVYIHYPGSGGVQISNVWRKFLYGWMFDGTRLFLSGYADRESRLMFRRQIQDRVKALAPFLHLDDDPYIVLSEGELYWIMDAYTASRYYPYSEPFSSRELIEYRQNEAQRFLSARGSDYLDGSNYIRNSVKVVVDAFEGSVDFYVFEPDDPVLRVWRSIFPGLFQDREEMPEPLQAHIRYPADMLLVQGLVYAKYHMTDPTVFYNQEDLWVRATEKYYNAVQPVEPYYIMWELPDSDEPQFVLMQPFTPKNRQVLIGWIAGMCDGENYGRLLAYKFPKEKRVLGPQQVETKIDQERNLSGQLTLWNQQGSSVIRGNVLAIPMDGTLLYVEPIYLQADTAAYPELRLVVVMHGDTLSYGQSFDEALKGLFEEGERPAALPAAEPATKDITALIQRADRAFRDYTQAMGRGDFEAASQALTSLSEALTTLKQEHGQPPAQVDERPAPEQ